MTEVHFYKTDLQANTFTPSYNAAMTIHQDGRITLAENERLREAALALYEAGRWELHDSEILPSEQAVMWANLRDALGLEPGHSTALASEPQP